MTTRRLLSSEELESLQRGPAMDPAANALRVPMAQLLLVTRDVPAGDTFCVRSTSLCPLTWRPYSQSVNIPLDDERVVRNLSEPGAECVLAEPTRAQLRELVICGQRAPDGVCEADIARLRLRKSLHIDVPGIADCPVNLECVVDHVERYHTHLIAFTRVVGASIDDRYIFRERGEIVTEFPPNLVDDVLDESGNMHRRASFLHDIYPCPTFPYAEKAGWGHHFETWMRDLRDEAYISEHEYELLVGWEKRLQELFSDLASPEREAVKTRLTEASLLIVQGRWAALHDSLRDS